MWRDHLGGTVNQPPTLAGDYNRNGTFESTDYVLWKLTFGQSVADWAAADGNGNGIVDAPDYTVWRGHLGATNVAPGLGSNMQIQESGPIAVVEDVALATSVADPAKRLDRTDAPGAAHKSIEGDAQAGRNGNAVAITVAPRGGSSKLSSLPTQWLTDYLFSAAPTRTVVPRLSIRDNSPTIDVSFHEIEMRLSEAFTRGDQRRMAVDLAFNSLNPQSKAAKASTDLEALGAKYLRESLNELAVALDEWSYYRPAVHRR